MGLRKRRIRRHARWLTPGVSSPAGTPSTGSASAAGLDHVLAQAVRLLRAARSRQDAGEVQRILSWIDARLDERLRLADFEG